jgi:DNA-binding transcriptional regulator of glucitol operon
MNCTAIRNRLLACEQPDFPPPEVREHLADCAECRSLQQRVVQLEQHLVALPVPPSDGRAAFVLRFLAGEEAFRPLTRLPAPRLAEKVRRKVALAFALAASLAVFALGWWSWPQPEPTSPPVAGRGDPRSPRQEQLDRALAAHTPAERVSRLADLAEKLQEDARTHQADPERRDEAARFCVQVVRNHLLEHARQVPPEERLALLNAVAGRVQRIESKASHLENELKAQMAPAAAASFGEIASAARDAERCLLALASGEAA